MKYRIIHDDSLREVVNGINIPRASEIHGWDEELQKWIYVDACHPSNANKLLENYKTT